MKFCEEYVAGEPQRFADWMVEMARKRQIFEEICKSGRVEAVADSDFRIPFKVQV